MPPESQADSFSERRRLLRARRLKRARCVFNNGASVFEVMLRDISPAGARIFGNELHWLPKTFELQILNSLGAYASREARLIWIKGGAAGIEFVD